MSRTVLVLAALASVASGQGFQQFAQLSSQVTQQTVALQSQLATAMGRVSTLTSQLANAQNNIASTTSTMMNSVATMNADLEFDVSSAVHGRAQLTAGIDTLSAAATMGATQVEMLSAMVSTHRAAITTSNSQAIVQMSSTARSQLTEINSEISVQVSQLAVGFASTATVSVNALNASALSAAASVTPLLQAMATTHYMSPSTPMFRWHMFHVYSNNGVSWFDGNNPRHFGGRHPSQWGDGNTHVKDMTRDIRQVARLFTRRGVGTVSGATVCSETWYLYSSTDTKYCVALFRIRNTGTSTINWRVTWHGTGWSGWGNVQTATVNGANTFSASCTWWCQRVANFPIAASAQRNRVSTVIFANGMSHPNHYSDNHHIETTFLGFNGLQLPNGLQYVDDMDTATGNWR